MLSSDSSPVDLQPAAQAHNSLTPRVDQQFQVRFWGVRGNVPTPGAETIRYGGNTACVEILVGDKRLIFDGGTGLRVLGKHLCQQMPVEAHLFFTHTHWDRIQGFPFFTPAFQEGNCFHIYGATSANGASIKQCLSEQMLRPNFPTPLQVMRSTLKFHEITPGAVISLDNVMIETLSLNRRNSAIGYRITWNGHSVVYATDTQEQAGCLDPSLMYLTEQADVLICNAGQLGMLNPVADQEISSSKPWEVGVNLAIATHVKKVILFHHHPEHEDTFLDHVEQSAQLEFPHTWVAREGMTLDLLE